jgi:signal peptidase I
MVAGGRDAISMSRTSLKPKNGRCLNDSKEPTEYGETGNENNPGLALLPEILKTLLLAMIIFLTARLLLLPYQVDGRSMAPNLEDQERVLVNRAVYMHFDLDGWIGWIPGVDPGSGDFYPFHSPDRGDIVVLNPPEYSEEPFIKRTIAVTGDRVSVRDGKVFVNGTELDEPYLDHVSTSCDSPEYCEDFLVPDDMIYVMGDNREHSYDSRAFGPVPLENVIGQAWFSNWPSERFGKIPDDHLNVP